MSIPSTGGGHTGKWLRNSALARYLGVSGMTLWRWQRDPALAFPLPTKINGIAFTHVDEIDAWMKARVVKRHGGGER